MGSGLIEGFFTVYSFVLYYHGKNHETKPLTFLLVDEWE